MTNKKYSLYLYAPIVVSLKDFNFKFNDTEKKKIYDNAWVLIYKLRNKNLKNAVVYLKNTNKLLEDLEIINILINGKKKIQNE